MSQPSSRGRREKPESNIAHVRPIIKEPISMTSQWSFPVPGQLSRMEGHLTPSFAAHGFPSSFPYMDPRATSAYQQSALMNALPPFHLLPTNDVFHAGLPTSYPLYGASLRREELLRCDVIAASAPFVHSDALFFLNNSLTHHMPYQQMTNYPYSFVKDSSNLEPYRPLVLSKPEMSRDLEKLERIPMKMPMTQIDESFHSRSSPTKRKCQFHEKLWDHKAPPEKIETNQSEISAKTKHSNHSDSKCVLRVPEIKAHHSAFKQIGRLERSNQSVEVLDLSIKRPNKPRYGRNDIPSDRRNSGHHRDLATRTGALTKASLTDPTGSAAASATCRKDTVIRLAPRLGKDERDGIFKEDNCRISHSVPFNNATHKQRMHGNHLKEDIGKVSATNCCPVSPQLDYENNDKKHRRKQHKPQYHKQESDEQTLKEPHTAISSTVTDCGTNLPSLPPLQPITDTHSSFRGIVHKYEITEKRNCNSKNDTYSDAKYVNVEPAKKDCQQGFLVQPSMKIAPDQTSNPDDIPTIAHSHKIENQDKLNGISKGQTQKATKRKAPSKLKSFNIKEILGKSHNDFKESVDSLKKRERKPKRNQGQKGNNENSQVDGNKDKSEVELTIKGQLQPLNGTGLENDKCSNKADGESVLGEECPQPLKRKRGRPRKSDSQAAGLGTGSIKTSKISKKQRKTGKKQRLATIEAQNRNEEIQNSWSEQKMPSEQKEPKFSLVVKRACVVLLCKLEMGGRRSVRMDELSDVSRCLGSEDAKNLHREPMSKSLSGLLQNQTKGYNGGGEALQEIFDLGGSMDGIGERVMKQDGKDPVRRKKRSCAYPYSPLLFAIGHCPLPRCVACKGHGSGGTKVKVKRRKRNNKIATKQLAQENGLSELSEVNRNGCYKKKRHSDQVASAVAIDDSVITSANLNVTASKEIDLEALQQRVYYYPDQDENYTNGDSSTHRHTHTDDYPSDSFSRRASPSKQTSNHNRENQSITNNQDECQANDDGNSVLSDQTELCVDEELDIEGLENSSCGDAERVENETVDGSGQSENRCDKTSSLLEAHVESAPKENGPILKDIESNGREIAGNEQDGIHFAAVDESFDGTLCFPERFQSGLMDGTTIFREKAGYNVNVNVGIGGVFKGDNYVQMERDSPFYNPRHEPLNRDGYDAPKTGHYLGERHIVAYKGIVTVDETEKVDMYPSGVFVSSAVS